MITANKDQILLEILQLWNSGRLTTPQVAQLQWILHKIQLTRISHSILWPWITTGATVENAAMYLWKSDSSLLSYLILVVDWSWSCISILHLLMINLFSSKRASPTVLSNILLPLFLLFRRCKVTSGHRRLFSKLSMRAWGCCFSQMHPAIFWETGSALRNSNSILSFVNGEVWKNMKPRP